MSHPGRALLRELLLRTGTGSPGWEAAKQEASLQPCSPRRRGASTRRARGRVVVPFTSRERCRSAEFLGEPDEKSFGPPDVAEPIRVLVLDHFTDELRTSLAEPGDRIVDVLHGEHDAQVAKRVHRGAPVIGDHRRRKKSREL